MIIRPDWKSLLFLLGMCLFIPTALLLFSLISGNHLRIGDVFIMYIIFLAIPTIIFIFYQGLWIKIDDDGVYYVKNWIFKSKKIMFSEIEKIDFEYEITAVARGGAVPHPILIFSPKSPDEKQLKIFIKPFSEGDLAFLLQTLAKHNPHVRFNEKAEKIRKLEPFNLPVSILVKTFFFGIFIIIVMYAIQELFIRG